MSQKEVLTLSKEEILNKLQTSKEGLTSQEALLRLKRYGENSLKKVSNNAILIFAKQFKSSLIYLFVFAAVLSFFLKDITDGIVITIILLLNALLGFFQEYKSEKAIEKLEKYINRQILVVRDKKTSLIEEK